MSKKLTIEEFVEKARFVHGDEYDYSKTEYINSYEKVCIICPKHGEFWMTPNAHISAKHKCPKCSHQSYKYSYDEIVNKINEKYPQISISNQAFNGLRNKGEFFCNAVDECGNKHGFFEKKVADVLRYGCPKCGRYAKLNKDIFIERSNKAHSNKYDYSNAEYINFETKVCIICPKHGEFWQSPHSHLSGVGCPLCSKENNINETILYEFIRNNIDCEVIREKKFEWLGLKSLDIFIPKLNIAIEYQGEQHFEPINFYGGIKTYNEIVKRDKEKNLLCKENNIRLFYFSKAKNIPSSYVDKVYVNAEELLREIKKYLS